MLNVKRLNWVWLVLFMIYLECFGVSYFERCPGKNTDEAKNDVSVTRSYLEIEITNCIKDDVGGRYIYVYSSEEKQLKQNYSYHPKNKIYYPDSWSADPQYIPYGKTFKIRTQSVHDQTKDVPGGSSGETYRAACYYDLDLDNLFIGKTEKQSQDSQKADHVVFFQLKQLGYKKTVEKWKDNNELDEYSFRRRHRYVVNSSLPNRLENQDFKYYAWKRMKLREYFKEQSLQCVPRSSSSVSCDRSIQKNNRPAGSLKANQDGYLRNFSLVKETFSVNSKGLEKTRIILKEGKVCDSDGSRSTKYTYE